MNVLIIGGGGFLGQKLAGALAERREIKGAPITKMTLADLNAPSTPDASFPVEGRAVDIVDAGQVSALMAEKPDVIYHLAAIVSGQAEAEFDLGMQINLYGSINVFEAARALGTNPTLVFTSSMAVFGGDTATPIGDREYLNPQTSYGAQKAAAELLLNDYSRKGFFDGRALRLPTITVRPGKPNAAASSFMSSIFREPLQGQEAICPVGPDYEHWFLSPRRCVQNLIIAAEIPAQNWGTNRCIALPGRTYNIGETVEAMRRVAGDEPVNRIRWEPDERIQAIVHGWKSRIDPSRALALGFVRDDSFEDNIRYFLEDDIQTPEGDKP
jgi:nucleoside-diphosphate-sugar epimerase